jgi:hypothetical protein
LIKASADSLLIIINDILDFSKLEAGKMELESIEFTLRACLEPTLKTLAWRARQKGLEFDCVIEPNVPDNLVGDPVRLRQILINLLGNSIKFTDRGGVALRVQQDAGDDQSIWLHFQIQDTGIGIPPEKVPHVFNAFEQADGSTARRFGGTGLGLTICRKLVETMGGRIWLESAAGKGSTFHFTTPMAAPRTTGSHVSGGTTQFEKNPAGDGQRSMSERKEHLNVLLAEDNLINQQLAVRLLEKRGHRVVVARNGREALAEVEKGYFDLVLMDIQMPELDGFEATRRIREKERVTGGHLPIVAMTAHAMQGDQERCLAVGMDDYVAKPINMKEFFAVIEAAVRSGKAAPVAGIPIDPQQSGIGNPSDSGFPIHT